MEKCFWDLQQWWNNNVGTLDTYKCYNIYGWFTMNWNMLTLFLRFVAAPQHVIFTARTKHFQPWCWLHKIEKCSLCHQIIISSCSRVITASSKAPRCVAVLSVKSDFLISIGLKMGRKDVSLFRGEYWPLFWKLQIWGDNLARRISSAVHQKGLLFWSSKLNRCNLTQVSASWIGYHRIRHAIWWTRKKLDKKTVAPTRSKRGVPTSRKNEKSAKRNDSTRRHPSGFSNRKQHPRLVMGKLDLSFELLKWL